MYDEISIYLISANILAALRQAFQWNVYVLLLKILHVTYWATVLAITHFALLVWIKKSVKVKQTVK